MIRRRTTTYYRERKVEKYYYNYSFFEIKCKVMLKCLCAIGSFSFSLPYNNKNNNAEYIEYYCINNSK